MKEKVIIKFENGKEFNFEYSSEKSFGETIREISGKPFWVDVDNSTFWINSRKVNCIIVEPLEEK